MNAMCGIDRGFALAGLGLVFFIAPRALPGAITFCPVGARCFIAELHAQFAESAKLEAIKANLRGLGYGG